MTFFTNSLLHATPAAKLVKIPWSPRTASARKRLSAGNNSRIVALQSPRANPTRSILFQLGWRLPAACDRAAGDVSALRGRSLLGRLAAPLELSAGGAGRLAGAALRI